MYPSIKTIEAQLGDVLAHEHGNTEPTPSRTLRRIMATDDRQWLLDTFDDVAKQDRQSFNPHDLVTLKMTALNQWLGGYGVEAIDTAMEYVNFGDTYDTTVIYDHRKQRFEIASWGDWLEQAEQHGLHKEDNDV